MIGTLPDVTMTGSAVQFTTTSTRVAWVMVTAPTTNNASGVRVGGSEVTTSRGASFLPGGGQFFPPAGNAHIYDLTQFWAAGTSGDTVRITYGS